MNPDARNTLGDLAAAMRRGVLSARACCAALLERIRHRDHQVLAWAALDESRALALAQACDDKRLSGPALGPLHGIPVGVKDIIDTADLPTEMGSPVFAGNRPAKNAALVERLLAAGAYVLGKTVTTEFAFLHPGKTRNPWNPAHTPGGSSSGSAAAVAAGFVPGAIGTQTNGSVIRPAAFCGVVGFKPGFGLSSCAGTLQFSASLDQIGVFTRSVADAAALASALAKPGSVSANVGRSDRPPRIAFLARFPWNQADPEAAAHFKAGMERLKGAGAVVAELSLDPAFDEAQRLHRTVMFYEGARQHAPRQAQHRASLSPLLNAAIDAGLGISDQEYAQAIAGSGKIRDLAEGMFDGCDVIACLPAPGVAPASLETTGDPSFCTLWSLTGFPAITIPTGLSTGRLPLGLQLAARAGADDALLRAAQWCEEALGFSASPGAGVHSA
jgi:Asp-tRNA(Asn)/Glu-tRNA(Gln) amidotransferase A subunit family amidase